MRREGAGTVSNLSSIPRNVLRGFVFIETFEEFLSAIGERDVFTFVAELLKEAFPDASLFANS